MKAVILAGGLGTRLAEETSVRPKPMVEIGGQPILWHIMKTYFAHGIRDFIVCAGYKGHVIKEYFANYAMMRSVITFDLESRSTEIHHNGAEPWRVTVVDTGEATMTGGRLRRIAPYLGSETFCMTYGDGLCNVNIGDVIEFHRAENALATLVAAQQPGRFGAFTLSESQTKVTRFREKPHGDGAWINGGYFVLEPQALDYIAGDSTSWEQEPLTRLAHDGRLAAYKHEGFWQPMDTLRDKNVLEEHWSSGCAPWKVWS